MFVFSTGMLGLCFETVEGCFPPRSISFCSPRIRCQPVPTSRLSFEQFPLSPYFCVLKEGTSFGSQSLCILCNLVNHFSVILICPFMAALGPTQSPIQWVPPGAISPGVKRPRREADHSFPSSSEVKNAWSYTSTPPRCLHGLVFS